MRLVRMLAVAAALCAMPRAAGSAPDDAPASVRGVVRDIARRPVAHVPVQCAGKFPRGGAPGYTDLVTDVEGRYEIRGLGPGETWVALLSERGVGDGGERRFAWSRPVEQDFVVHGELDLSGRVVAAEDGPFDLELEWNQDAGAGAWHPIVARRVRLPADGAFRFTALRPGVYTLQVTKERVARGMREVELFASASGVQVALSPERKASFALRAVAAWPDKPEYASAWLLPEGSALKDTVYGEQRDGVFHFDHLAVGRHWAAVRHVFGEQPEDSVARWRWFPFDVAERSPPATVTCGPAEDVRVVIEPPKGRKRLQGRVVIVHGPYEAETKFELQRAADGVVSIWEPPDRTPGLPPGLRKEPEPDEGLSLRDVVVGTAQIRVEALGCAPVERTVDVAGATRVEVALPGLPGREVAFSENAGASAIQHLRVEARRDEPKANWTEILWWRLWPRGSHSPIPGTFRAFLAPGRWRFRATCDRFADADIGPIDVATEGGLLLLSAEWREGAAVSGRVLLHDIPVHEGWVYPQRFEDGGWRPLAAKEVFIDDGGVYRVAGLSPGRYRFAGTSRGLPVLGEVEVARSDMTLNLAVPSTLRTSPR